MNSKKILILGGDMRQVSLAESFTRDGADVAVFGFSPETVFSGQITRAGDLADALDGRDIIITGLPVTNDDITVRTPLYDGKIYFYELFKLMKKNQLLLGGKITKKIMNLGKIYTIPIIDYFEREEMTVLNAIPTAEGAIEIAMRELPVTVHGSEALVLGFGRIGKVLAHSLKGLGAQTWVEARKFEDLAWIRAYGYRGIHLSELKEQLGRFDVIYNTIPHEVLDEKLLGALKPDCLIIDLASAPGGVDPEKARAAGVKVLPALSLPGKVAPVTAGEIIKHTICNIISDLGV